VSIASKVVGLLKGVFGLAKTTAGLKADYPLLLPNGTASAPGMSFLDGQSGLYRTGGDIGVTAGGGPLARFDSSAGGLTVGNFPLAFGASVAGASDLFLRRDVAGVVRITNGATGAGGLSSAANSPAQITADQNNYAAGVGLFQRWSSDAARTVTGMVAGQDGELRFVWNVGAQSIVLANESASSTAANRFTTSTAASLTVTAGKCALCQYDATSARWRATLLP
jgi:hypothetical protein